MKQLTTYNRVAGYLNKIFDLLNEHYFQGELVRPTITIQSTPKAYGHFSTRPDTWVSVTGNSFELNLGAGTIGRPIEEVCATVLHETDPLLLLCQRNQRYQQRQSVPQQALQSRC